MFCLGPIRDQEAPGARRYRFPEIQSPGWNPDSRRCRVNRGGAVLYRRRIQGRPLRRGGHEGCSRRAVPREHLQCLRET